MEIHSTGGTTGPDPIQPRPLSGRSRPIPPQTPATDRAEISDHARLLARLRAVPDIRSEKVEELRALIKSGKYETPERIQKAVEKLLEELE